MTLQHGCAGTPSPDQSTLLLPLCFEICAGSTSLSYKREHGQSTPFLAHWVYLHQLWTTRNHTHLPHVLCKACLPSTSSNLLPSGDDWQGRGESCFYFYSGAPFIDPCSRDTWESCCKKNASHGVPSTGLREWRNLGVWSLGHGKVGTAIPSFKFIHWQIIEGFK